MELAPIALFGYNRPNHIQMTIDALKKNELADKSILYVFLDGCRTSDDLDKINEVKRIVSQISGFKKCILFESSENKGVDRSIREGISYVLENHRRVIVVEDDIITSSKFLRFMNEALSYYEKYNHITSIGGFNFANSIPQYYNEDIYLSLRSCSWGWATWKDRWEEVTWNVDVYDKFRKNRNLVEKFNQCGEDFTEMLEQQLEGKLNAWDVYFCFNQMIRNKYTIIPVKSLTKNIGLDGSGIHCSNTNQFELDVDDDFQWSFSEKLQINNDIMNQIRIKFMPKSYRELLQDYKNKFDFMNRWLNTIFEGQTISNNIISMYGIKCVVIYGHGTIGINLYKQIRKEGILQIKCFIDKHFINDSTELDCITLEEYCKKVNENDLIIITPYYYYKDIKDDIRKKIDKISVVSIEKLLV
ncbi:glycosyltransferase family 2 protein [Inconstantimicrobium mannanitabidum]|uniref:Uncharacterized protein n=1 Tax=Inconstantimicrobium mannanitabidum TaxID=1604901 RepID=A0ACB5R8K8_9CLOT|nr:hypothetical protein [Clostridium sp. TW13]GKX65512.1 hypothetical protein rsdtw13_07700 [Clostridium sp. TW13]